MKKKKILLSDMPKPKITVDKRLDEVNTEGWFQDKVDKANHILKTAGLPKGFVIP